MKLSRLFIIIMAAVLLTHTAIASFTNNFDDSRNKYSLKHLNKVSNNYLSFQQRYHFTQSANSFFYTREANGLSMSAPVSTFIFSQKTTTTFVYPYKYTVKVPKFKAPVRPQ